MLFLKVKTYKQSKKIIQSKQSKTIFVMYLGQEKQSPNGMDSSLLRSISIKSADLSKHDEFFYAW